MSRRQTVSPKEKKSFHHGNLRQALLLAARERLEKVGHERLSLRELAGSAGVSTAAPYHHFRSKEALLRALADDALEQLGVIFEHALRLEADPAQRLREACRSYLELAARQPNLYRLIFVDNSHWVEQEIRSRGLSPSYEMFERLVREVAVDVSAAPGAVATACWSLLHGFALLRMSDRLVHGGSSPQLERVVLDSVLRIAANR